MHNHIPIILKLIMDPGRTFATTDGSSRAVVLPKRSSKGRLLRKKPFGYFFSDWSTRELFVSSTGK